MMGIEAGGWAGLRMAGAAVLLAATPVAVIAQAASPRVEAELDQLVDAFVAAQGAYDQRALGALTTPDYVEVSPVGDVDTREEMLGFYAPDKKRAAPPITITERTVSVHGTEALVLAKLSMTVPVAGGGTRSIDLRASYVARKVEGRWRLAAAQFTPIRSSAPTPPAGG